MNYLLVDSNNLAFRCWKALPLLTNSSGNEIQVIFGFLKTLRASVDRLNADKIICVFDGSPVARTQIFPEYKQHRKKERSEYTEEEQQSYQQFKEQMNYLKVILNYLGVKVVHNDSVEADDIIACYVSKLALDSNNQVIVISEDKDFIQLVDKPIISLYRPMSNKCYTQDSLSDQVGFDTAEQFLHFRVLNGDPSDGIPALPGFGGKEGVRATKLIKLFGTVFNAFENLEVWPKGKVFDDLKTRKAEVARNFLLMSLSFSKEFLLDRVDLNLDFPEVQESEFKKYLIKNEFVSILSSFRVFISSFRK